MLFVAKFELFVFLDSFGILIFARGGCAVDCFALVHFDSLALFAAGGYDESSANDSAAWAFWFFSMYLPS